MDGKLKELATEKPWRLLVKYSWPALVSMSLNALYAVVDRFYIGHGCGEAAMAGLTLVFPLMMLFGAFGVFVGAGHAAVLSIKLGEGDRVACEKLLGQLTAFKLSFFFVLTPIVYFNIDPILNICGGSGVRAEAFDCARRYLRIVLFSHIFSHLAFGYSALMRAEGSAKKSMMCMIVGFGTNLVLDPIFIFGFGLGIAGAAVATNIAMFASCVFALSHYIGGRSVVKFRWRRIGFHKGLLAKPCGIGFSPFLQQLLGALINVAYPAAFAKWAVDKAAATTQIASLGVFESVLILVLMPVLGAQQGIQPIIGYNWGARNYRRVRDAYLLGVAATSVLCVIATIIQVVPPFPTILARMFVSSDNAELVKLAAKDLQLANCMLWCIGLNIASTTYFQSIGKPIVAIVLSTMRQGFIMLPMIWFLPLFMRDHTFAIWLSMPVSDVLCCLATVVPFMAHVRFLSRVRDRTVEGAPSPPRVRTARAAAPQARPAPKCRAFSMVSGGLDSQLAVRIMQRAGAYVEGVCFSTPFFSPDAARKAAEALGIKLHVVDFTDDEIKLIENPPHGFGGAMNPCIDCHATMIRRTGELMAQLGFDCVSTGEVMGQRPMSQNKQALDVVEKTSGLKGRLVRPLSAKLLEPTQVEKLGLLDREKLMDISGRGRDRQIALAKEFGISDFPSPAGGCKLTEKGYGRKLKDLKDHEGLKDRQLVEMLNIARRFRMPSGSGVMLGRDRIDNAALKDAGFGVLLSPVNCPGPTALVPNLKSEADLLLALKLVAAYSRCDRLQDDVEVAVRRDGAERRVKVPRPYDRDNFKEYHIC